MENPINIDDLVAPFHETTLGLSNGPSIFSSAGQRLDLRWTQPDDSSSSLFTHHTPKMLIYIYIYINIC